ncbi:hypothetical protein [Kribbella qitaiheensis]|uniref:hypothetical protein n=1 Tax=Kribbella qitaiheensis TaxID=1544730 RepID=UPI001FE74CDD|nr:hypothetical protein [Kribbella qitaiheensis]
MLFAGSDRDGVAEGRITTAYRRWAEPRVVAGRVYRTNAGRIEIESISQINPDLLADNDADVIAADRGNAKDVRRRLRGNEDWPTFLIRFRLVEGPDPREELAASADLSDADLADLGDKLAKLDELSRHGAWTTATLRQIQAKPATRARRPGRRSRPRHRRLQTRRPQTQEPGPHLQPRNRVRANPARHGVPQQPGLRPMDGHGLNDRAPWL